MDDALIDTYLHQQTMSNRVRDMFTMHALAKVISELKGKFLGKPIDIKNA